MPQLHSAMDLWYLASLIILLSPSNLLRGDARHLVEQAWWNPRYGPGCRYIPHVSRNESGNVKYMLFYHDEFMLVLFPGSRMTAEDWAGERGNFSLKRVAVPRIGGKVHEGFWKQVDSYWSELAAQLDQFPHVPVVVGGHSRGGACAVIAGLRIERELRNRLAAVITVGQPKCVNFQLAARIQHEWAHRYVRIVSSTDPVPLVPSEPWYYHAGTVWFYDDCGVCRVNPAALEMEAAIRSDNPAAVREHGCVVKYALAVVKQAWASISGHKLAYYYDLVHGIRWASNGA